MPKLANICTAKFVKDSRMLGYQETFDGEMVEVDFLKPKCIVSADVPTATHPRGVPSSKRANLIKLAESFPSAKRKFWHDLVINDANSDLLKEFE